MGNLETQKLTFSFNIKVPTVDQTNYTWSTVAYTLITIINLTAVYFMVH